MKQRSIAGAAKTRDRSAKSASDQERAKSDARYAAHGEIASRYDRERKKRQGIHPSQLRGAELMRLFRDRLGPEPSKTEIDDHIFSLIGPDNWKLTAEALGERVSLTYAERDRLRIHTIFCHDKTRSEVAEIRRSRKNEGARHRRQWIKAEREVTRNSKESAVPRTPLDVWNCSERTQAIYHAISPPKWMSLRKVVDAAHGLFAFRGLSNDALRQAVHRAVRELSAGGLVTTEQRPSARGLKALFVRRLDDPAAFPPLQQAWAE